MLRDLHYALRVLRRSPGFSGVAIVTLALGIGANMTVFSIVQGLLLRRLPIADPARVFAIDAVNRDGHSYPDHLDLHARNTTFAGMAAYPDQGIRDQGSGIRSPHCGASSGRSGLGADTTRGC